MPRLRKDQHIHFEMGVRNLVAGMELDPKVKLHFSHTKTGVTAVLGYYEPSSVDGQCIGMVKAGRRCRIEALPGEAYCGHHINQKLEDIDG